MSYGSFGRNQQNSTWLCFQNHKQKNKDSSAIFIDKLFKVCRSETSTQLEVVGKSPLAWLRPNSDQLPFLEVEQRDTHTNRISALENVFPLPNYLLRHNFSASCCIYRYVK